MTRIYGGNMAERIEVSDETRERLVDLFLEHKGVPRKDLFEYPYNEYESRDLINSAEAYVDKVLRILNS